jgi:hypothetical protein
VMFCPQGREPVFDELTGEVPEPLGVVRGNNDLAVVFAHASASGVSCRSLSISAVTSSLPVGTVGRSAVSDMAKTSLARDQRGPLFVSQPPCPPPPRYAAVRTGV